jgi:hypothetical protein
LTSLSKVTPSNSSLIFADVKAKTVDVCKLYKEELHNLYSSPNIIRITKSRRMRLAGHVALIGAKRNAPKIFLGKPEGKRPLGKPRRRW